MKLTKNQFKMRMIVILNIYLEAMITAVITTTSRAMKLIR